MNSNAFFDNSVYLNNRFDFMYGKSFLYLLV